VERRKTTRFTSRVAISCSSGQRRESAIAYDLSTDGCLLQTSAAFVHPGDVVRLNVPGEKTLSGRVVWTKNRNAGVQFDTPLSRSSVARLASDAESICLQPSGSWASVRQPITPALGQLGALALGQSCPIASLISVSVSAVFIVVCVLILWST
jgi:hypothetical protein